MRLSKFFLRNQFLVSKTQFAKRFGTIDLSRYSNLDFQKKDSEFFFALSTQFEDKIVKVQIQLNENNNISDLIAKLKDFGFQSNELEAITTDEVRLHLETSLKNALSHNFYLYSSEKNRLVKLINKSVNPHDSIDEFAKDIYQKIRIPFTYQKLVYEYLQRLESSYKRQSSESLFEGLKTNTNLLNKDILVQSILDAIQTHKGRNLEEEELQYKEFLELNKKIDVLENMKTKLEKRVNFSKLVFIYCEKKDVYWTYCVIRTI